MVDIDSRLFDPTWRKIYLGWDAAWNIDALHLLGRPVSADVWRHMESLRDAGYTPTQAIEEVDDDYRWAA